MAYERYEENKRRVDDLYGRALEHLRGAAAQDDLEALRVKRDDLAREVFKVAVVGQVKAGKSTLLNAMVLHERILPVDRRPHTDKVTELEYGEPTQFSAKMYTKERWSEVAQGLRDYSGSDAVLEATRLEIDDYVRRGDGLLDSQAGRDTGWLPVDQLHRYVARKGENTPLVERVRLHHSSPFLKHASLIDTPGTNDPNQARSRVAHAFVKQADAVLMLLYSLQALTQADRRFIQGCLVENGFDDDNVIIAVNKSDSLEPDERAALETWLRSKSKNEVGVDLSKRPLHFVSSLMALLARTSPVTEEQKRRDDFAVKRWKEDGRISSESDLWAESGMASLEGDLSRFLGDEVGPRIHRRHLAVLRHHTERGLGALDGRIEAAQEALDLGQGDVEDLATRLQQLDREQRQTEQVLEEFTTDVKVDATSLFTEKMEGHFGDVLQRMLARLEELEEQHKREFERAYQEYAQAVDQGEGRHLRVDLTAAAAEMWKATQDVAAHTLERTSLMVKIKPVVSEIERTLADFARDNQLVVRKRPIHLPIWAVEHSLRVAIDGAKREQLLPGAVSKGVPSEIVESGFGKFWRWLYHPSRAKLDVKKGEAKGEVRSEVDRLKASLAEVRHEVHKAYDTQLSTVILQQMIQALQKGLAAVRGSITQQLDEARDLQRANLRELRKAMGEKEADVETLAARFKAERDEALHSRVPLEQLQLEVLELLAESAGAP